jgi:hypothetical protein
LSRWGVGKFVAVGGGEGCVWGHLEVAVVGTEGIGQAHRLLELRLRKRGERGGAKVRTVLCSEKPSLSLRNI